ncbi:MAG TPA: hypothetical protein VGE93_06860, partial [Bryobacteraceae bacterium]
APSADSREGTSPANDQELQQLRERIAQQERAIRQLQESVQEQRALLDKAIQNTNAAAPKIIDGKATANNQAPAEPPTRGESAPAKVVPVSNAAHPRLFPVSQGGAEQHQTTASPSPLSIKIGNTSLTPLGFVDATFFARSTNLGSGIGTSFAGIPFNNSVAGHTSEMNFSTQNSRIGFRVDSTVLGAKVLGYFEGDFLGFQPANAFVTSNSSTFRLRNYFVDVQKNGLEVLGGQDWSMFTPNRKGLSPVPSDIFYTQDMDTNYQAGLPWSRQTQFRFVAHPSNDLAFGVSLENPQQYAGNNLVTYPTALNSIISGSNEFNNGNTTTSTPNESPDVIFKAAYDGHVGNGRIMHVEAGALIRNFKITLPFTSNGIPTSSTTGDVRYHSDRTTAVTGEVNANLEVAKNFRIIVNTFFGSGGGRYLFGMGPDAIVRADGTLSPVHAYSTLDGFEANIAKNTLISVLYGAAYFGRNVALDTNGKYIGYGYSGSPNSNNRNVQEATFDVVRTLWKSPSYGALSLIGQYSYLWRDPWYVAPGGARNARTNLYYLNLRYTLP